MTRKTFILPAIVSGVALSGCARLVVLDPEFVRQKNSADWVVKNEPRKATDKR